MKYCVFRLYAPLCSWGEIAVGGERRSAFHPSKSAIIGLIAAAMGLEREDAIALRRIDPGLLTENHPPLCGQLLGKEEEAIYVDGSVYLSTNGSVYLSVIDEGAWTFLSV